MSDAASNTSNMAGASTTYQTPVSSAQPQVTTQPVTTTPIDMTNVGSTTVETVGTPEETKTQRFDSDTATVSSNYWMNMQQQYNIGINPAFNSNENGEEYMYGLSLNDSDALKNSYKGQFLRDARFKDSYNESKEFFANSSQEYTYGRLYDGQKWINVRTPIDKEGNPTGLPEKFNDNALETFNNNMNNLFKLSIAQFSNLKA